MLCTFWLAEALPLADQANRAPSGCERAAGFANDLGLLVEEVDLETGELLGSFPQAFSLSVSATPPGQSAKPSDELILDHVPSP